MDGLRWLLLLVGLLVIGGVYLYSRREKAPADEDEAPLGRVEPSLDDADPVAGPFLINKSTSSDDVGVEDEEDLAATNTPQKIVTVRIVAREKKSFPGDELILSMRGIGLRHGKFGIFHRYDGSDESKTVFSAASLVEPGSFDLQNIKGQKIPGISLFMILPGPVDSTEAFDSMMAAARTLTQSLNGELLDESGSTLSIQRERYLREEIIQFQHSSLAS
jgi:cell division protein ZipA